jgi:hypothetical protein
MIVNGSGTLEEIRVKKSDADGRPIATPETIEFNVSEPKPKNNEKITTRFTRKDLNPEAEDQDAGACKFLQTGAASLNNMKIELIGFATWASKQYDAIAEKSGEIQFKDFTGVRIRYRSNHYLGEELR